MFKFYTIVLLCLALSIGANAQTHTPVYLSQNIANANSKGFYRYLPADYSTSGKNYPLIIWLHGAGQVGAGTTADLPKVLWYGLPNVISTGGFPASFSVNDSNYSFIVISPQFAAWPTATNVGGILTYVMANYRVDPERVYLLGMSAGGGGVWDYASASVTNSNKLAAIIPFAGTVNPTQTQANRIASTQLPVWAFHNTNDGTVPVTNSRNWRTRINGYVPAPTPLMRLTEFPVVSSNAVIAHDCWTNTTVPTYKVNNQNIYEWLLNYKRRETPVNIAPFAAAGDDIFVVLPSTVNLNGQQSSDPDGSIVSYRWRKVSGPASHLFSDSTIVNPVVQNLSAGLYTFELTVTDNQNASGKDTVLVNVSQALEPGAANRVLIDIGPSPTIGALTASPTNGLYWNNMTDARPGVRVSNAKSVANQTTAIGITVVNRIDGTANTASNGMNGGNTTPAVGDYPVNATRDFAYAHNSTTSGRWKVTGLNPNNLYVIKFWGSKSGETTNRDIEIKRADESVWKSYVGGSNTNFNQAASFNVTGKTEMDFDIRAKAPSIYGYINVVDISWSVPGSPSNLPPVANAGANINLQLPLDSVTLNGCSSIDPEGAALQFKWRILSGAAGAYLSNDNLCNSKLKGITAGTFTLELLVTDTGGLSHRDSLTLVATPAFSFEWPVLPAPLCAQPYKIVILGSSTAVGTGATPLDSSWANKFAKFVHAQNAQVQITNLALGGYNSYHLCPTGSVPGANKPFPDTARNITAALARNPDAIIINLPSNDAAAAFTLQETQINIEKMIAAADARNIPVWVTTSQPRSGLSVNATNNLILFKDWVLQRFAAKSVDFWTNIANADGSVNNYYSAGDGIHINNYGHHVVFTRMLQEKIWDTICLRRAAAVNMPPVANAGADVMLQWPTDSVRLNGSASYDADGVITQYNWRQLAGTTATIANAQAINPLVQNLQTGNYLFELEVTDDSLATRRDSVSVRVNAQPMANAGGDASITLPQSSITLNGSTSYDTDGNITSYAWRRISGTGNAIIANASAAQSNVTFSAAGIHMFELTVRDNDAGISKDSVSITVHPDPNLPPVAEAGSDQSIQLPVNKVLLDGRMSADPNGSIASYQWTLVSGPQASVLATPSKDSTTVTFVNSGVYIYRLTVTDDGGLTANDDVQITVVPAPVTTKAIKVNVVNAGITYNNAQWNSWNPVANVNSATFKYEDGTQSTVFANMVQGGNFSDNGANYQPAATGCPPEVLRINSMHTIQRSLVISGLNTTKNYNFEFYGSRAFTSNSRSIYRTGTVADTISTDFNGNDVARLNNLKPDNNGRITFTLSIIGSYHYMAGFTITEPASVTGRAPVEEGVISINNNMEADNEITAETIIYPNPFKDRLLVKPGNQHAGATMITVSDATGKPLWQKNIAAGNSNAVEIILPFGLQKGIYFLQIVSAQKRSVHKLIKH